MARTLFDQWPDAPLAARPGAPVARPYQREAVRGGSGQRGIVAALAEDGRCMVEMATGLGKTVVMGFAAAHHLATTDTSVMLVAHREELVTQAAAELEPIIGFRPEIEMGEYWANPRSRCVVGSVQTLFGQKRLSRFDAGRFGLLMPDECHHCVASNRTYGNLLSYFSGANLLGVTATARRAKEKSGRNIALGPVFGSVAYSMGIREAVEQAWLVPVRQHTIRSKLIDLTEVGTTNGDLNQGQLGLAMTQDERVVWEIAGAVVEHCGDQPTLVFSCPRPPGELVGQGQLLANRLNRLRPNSAVFLSGETPSDDRRAQIRRFEAGEFPYLIGCSLFTEGFNVPSIANVVMARPTESIVYYTQAIGRGTRTLRGVLTPEMNGWEPSARLAAIQASAKPYLTVYDFAGNAGKHKLISAVDIFAGDAAGCPAARKVKEKSAGGPVEVLAEMQSAERAEEKKRAAVKVQTVTEVVNPFDYSDAGGRAAASRKRTDPATEGQKEYIERRGGLWRDGMTVAEAGKVIADVDRRFKSRLCTQKQQRTLARLGFPDVERPKVHASALLDWAEASGWPWDRMRRPERRELGIRAVEGGFRLTIRGHLVGGVYATIHEVRQAYEGLAVDHGRSN